MNQRMRWKKIKPLLDIFKRQMFRIRYILAGFIILSLPLGCVIWIMANLEGMEKNRLAEYRSIAEQTSKSTFNFITGGYYDHMLDAIRIITTSSVIQRLEIYLDGDPVLTSGNSQGLEKLAEQKPDATRAWEYRDGQQQFVIFDNQLPTHPDLLPNTCIVRAVFNLDEFSSRKMGIQAALGVIFGLLLVIIILLFILHNADIQKMETVQGISHDARKVLNRISPRLQEIYQQLRQGKGGETAHRDIKLTWEDSVALRRFLDNLEDYENVRRDRLPLQPAAKDIIRLLHKKPEQFEVTLAKEGKRLTLDLQVDELVLQMDAYVVDRILTNLIDNAIKFTAVRTSIDIRLEMEQEAVVVFIKDHGPGIARKNWKRIFRAYRRLNTDKPGSGLGLFNARSLARLIGGEVGIRESRPGQGTTFYFRLPVRPAP
ncbi:sensor histidine kinase [candidate division FCPU426 bacterium]|nr:sensor histidine kinase [candidate division FCPU426 bacterium]